MNKIMQDVLDEVEEKYIELQIEEEEFCSKHQETMGFISTIIVAAVVTSIALAFVLGVLV